MTYSEIAEVYLERGFKPIPVRGKSMPPAGATGRQGTVTREKVVGWAQDPEWARQNVALRAEGFITIDVDDYGSNNGATDLAELEGKLGELPATISSTSRGADSPSRQYFFALPESDIELVSEIGDSIQLIQHHHRYVVVNPSVHPDTGSTYEWYDFDGALMTEPPSLTELEYLPEAWLDFLRAPEHQYSHEQYDGPQVEFASEAEERAIATITRELDDLPRPWHEGAGWRSTAYRLSCWLWRMVNSAAYAINEMQAKELMFQHCPTNDQWTVSDLLIQWQSAQKSTVGQFADLPDEVRPQLLQPLETLNLMPGDIFDLANREPSSPTAAARWDLRQRIIVGMLEAGAGEVAAASAAWHAPVAGIDLRNDQYGENKLWREVAQATAKAAAKSGAGITAAPASERPALVVEKEKLLTDSERALLAGEEGRWWGTRYNDWAKTRVSMWNPQYHNMNRWQILSLVFSPYGFIPKKRGPMGLNLFSMVLGETTTGKTEAMFIARSVIRACFPVDDPDIGGDASPNALVEKLIERDGLVSWFNADEAHGLFAEMSAATWRTGLVEKWTDLYEGYVPMIQRAMKKDLSGVRAKTHFVVHMMGTEDGMVNALDRTRWESGFLARFVWAVGERLEIAPEEMEVDEEDGDLQQAYDAMPRQWAAEFAAATRGMHPDNPRPMRFEPMAKERHLDLLKQLQRVYKGHKYESILKPTMIRFGDIIRKCAALVALSEGSPVITLRHERIAIEQGEEWMTNAIEMIRRTTDTMFARRVDEIEQFIAKRANQQARKEVVYRFCSPAEKSDVDKWIAQLVAEGRASDETQMDGGRIIKLKIAEEAA